MHAKFFLENDCLTTNFNFLLKFFKKMYKICMISIFHTLSLWICMISIFGLLVSTRSFYHVLQKKRNVSFAVFFLKTNFDNRNCSWQRILCPDKNIILEVKYERFKLELTICRFGNCQFGFVLDKVLQSFKKLPMTMKA